MQELYLDLWHLEGQIRGQLDLVIDQLEQIVEVTSRYTLLAFSIFQYKAQGLNYSIDSWRNGGKMFARQDQSQ